MTLFSRFFRREEKSSESGLAKALPVSPHPAETESPVSEDNYFSLLVRIQDWQAKKQYDKMLHCCEKSLPLLKGFVAETKREYGSFDISSIPAVEVGCRYWAALGHRDKLENVKKVVRLSKELREGWLDLVNASFEDADLSERIRMHLAGNPGFPQNHLGKALKVSGRDTSRLINTLSNIGVVKRTPVGKTYALYLTMGET